MNAPSTITADRHATAIRDAQALARAATRLAAALSVSGGKWSSRALHCELEAMVAAMALWPDDPIAKHLDTRLTELGLDEEGASFNPSRVHPDNPAQSKGYL